MKKKDILEDALLTAKEIEEAAKRNAQDYLVEAFSPRLTDVIRQTIQEEEGPGPQLDSPVTNLAKGEEEETESDEVQNDAEVSDGHPEGISPTQGDHEISGKGKKHDLDRTAPAPGNMTEAEGEEEEMEEGEDHDLGKLHFDDRDSGDSEFKQHSVNEEMDDEEDELELEQDEDEEELDLDGAPEQDPVEPEDDVFEEEDEEDEELDLPDELFDDEDDQEPEAPVADDEESLEEPMDDAPEGEEDLELGDDDEELDIDIEDDEEDMEEQDMAMDDEEFEEGLYVRREGQFVKVDPAEALQSKMDDLEEERDKLANAVGFLRGQLGEVNLFNAKLSHLVKLYESGLFTRREKQNIAERLDGCNTIKQVQSMYKSIVNEADSRTVLDDIHDVITENRVRRTAKPTGESVYESPEVKRMKKLAGLDD